MDNKDDENLREFTRTSAKVKVLIKSGDKVVHSGKTHDLSMRGFFVQTKDKIPIGEECDVTMILGGLEQPIQFKLKGRVQRVSGVGIGIKFTEIDMEGYQHLKNLIMLNTPEADSAKVEKEIREHIGLKKRQEPS